MKENIRDPFSVFCADLRLQKPWHLRNDVFELLKRGDLRLDCCWRDALAVFVTGLQTSKKNVSLTKQKIIFFSVRLH
jgi:hypothetical protein